MLDLRVANLKTIEDFEPIGVKAEFFGSGYDQAPVDTDDQSCIGPIGFPNAGRIGGHDIDIAVNRPAAMCETASLAGHIDRTAEMYGNAWIRQCRGFNSTGRIGHDAD